MRIWKSILATIDTSMKLQLLKHGVIADNEVLPAGSIIEVGEHRAHHLIKAGAAKKAEEPPAPKPITINIKTNADEIEVASVEHTIETPEKPKPKRRRKAKATPKS